MKVTLVRQQLCCRNVLDADRVVCGVRNDGIAVRVIVGSGQVCKDRPADLDCVLGRIEVRNRDLAKIRSTFRPR
jgi:hypothetical protein